MDSTSDEVTTVGRRLRHFRHSRGLSQKVVAERAGISGAYLSLLESGQRALDSRALTKRLANALSVAPTDINSLPMPMSSIDDGLDLAVDRVRAAMQSVAMGMLTGETQSVEQLRYRIHDVLAAKQRCEHAIVGSVLPQLILDLHTSIGAGRGDAELLGLAAVLHHSGTQAFLHGAGAAPDLCWQAARMSADASERLDDPVSLGISAFGQANGLLAWGNFDLASTVVSRVDMSAVDDELVGMLTLTLSLISTAQEDKSNAASALEHAAELATRTGESNRHYLSFGPTNVAMWRLSNALEGGDGGAAIRLAEGIDPARIVAPTRRANYWVNYGRALSTSSRRRPEAVRALSQAERISPDKIHRNPFAHNILGELLGHVKRDAVGTELRGMAYRSGFPV